MIKNKLAWNRINDILLKFEGVTYQYTDRRSLKLSHSFTVLSVLVKLKARKVKTLAIYYHTTSIFSISQQFHILQTYVLAFQRFFSFIQENVIWIVRLLVLPSHFFPPCFPLYYVLSTAIEYIVPLLSILTLSISPIKQFNCNWILDKWNYL